jgi:Holliday junction resolvase RusA-like endonuclease
MILLIEGINPQPWMAGKLSTKRAGHRVLPIQFKDENLRVYQEALHESAAEALSRLEAPLPLFPKGTLLRVHFSFWRKIEQYTNLETGKVTTPKVPDVSNMVKATEDALQGLFYFNDRDNRVVTGHLVDVGPDVEPIVMVAIEQYEADKIPLWMIDLAKTKGTRTGSTWLFNEV